MASSTVIGIILLSIASKLSAFTIPENYDPAKRPNFGSVADVVNVDVNLLAVRGVDEENAEMTVDVSLQASWVDSRLIGLVSRNTLFVNKIPDFWLPNVQIANAAAESMDKSSSRALELNDNGLVKLSEKRTARITCPVSLAKYPFDRQVCRIQINSYGYSTVHLVLFWHGTISYDIPVYHPEFSFSYAEQTSENIKNPGGAEYSNLYLEIGVTRCPLRVIFRALVPSLVLLFFSYYMSFWHCSLIVKHKKAITANGNGNHHVEAVQQTVIITQPNHAPHDFLSGPKMFHLLLAAINGINFLLTVLIAQINFIESPKSSAVSGLDVWLNFVMAIIFVILWHRVQLFFDEFFKSSNSEKQEHTECYANRTTNILKLGIPPVVVVFLVMYFGIYLS